VPVAGGAETQVIGFQRNKPSQLVFLVPAGMSSGDCHLEGRARMTNSTELRTGRLDPVRTV